LNPVLLRAGVSDRRATLLRQHKKASDDFASARLSLEKSRDIIAAKLEQLVKETEAEAEVFDAGMKLAGELDPRAEDGASSSWNCQEIPTSEDEGPATKKAKLTVTSEIRDRITFGLAQLVPGGDPCPELAANLLQLVCSALQGGEVAIPAAAPPSPAPPSPTLSKEEQEIEDARLLAVSNAKAEEDAKEQKGKGKGSTSYAPYPAVGASAKAGVEA
jgi:hypothetical protein